MEIIIGVNPSNYNSKIKNANQYALTYLEYTQDEVKGLNFSEIFEFIAPSSLEDFINSRSYSCASVLLVRTKNRGKKLIRCCLDYKSLDGSVLVLSDIEDLSNVASEIDTNNNLSKYDGFKQHNLGNYDSGRHRCIGYNLKNKEREQCLQSDLQYFYETEIVAEKYNSDAPGGCFDDFYSSDAVSTWVYNRIKGTFIANNAWMKSLGYNEEEHELMSLLNVEKLIHIDDLTSWKALLNRNEKVSGTFNYRVYHKDSSVIFLKSIWMGDNEWIKGVDFNVTDCRKTKERLEYKRTIEKLIAKAALALTDLEEDVYDKTINQLLGDMVDLAGVDRAYVFLLNSQKNLLSNTHEQCAKGITSEKDNLQNISVDDIPWWMNKVNTKQHIYLKTLDSLPAEGAENERMLLSSQGIVSLLVVPIYYKETVLGCMGFDAVGKEQIWTEADIYLLKAIGKTIGSTLFAFKNKQLLLDAKQKAQESDELKTIFLNNLSHEIRTPMNGIMGFTELLKEEGEVNGEQSIYLENIINSCESLLGIITDIVEMSKIEAGNLQLFRRKTNLQRELDRVSSEIVSQANSNDLIVNVFGDLSKPLYIDCEKYLRILSSLLSNAIKFSREGEINVTFQIDSGTLVTTVQDFGIGIPDIYKKKIFERFWQIEGNTTRSFGGLGLGLTIAKAYIELMNGEIEVESQVGVGSLFRVKIPGILEK